MTEISDAELRDKAERCEEIIDRTVDRWENIPPERKPYVRLGLKARGCGIYTLLLGDTDSAREWFAESSARYLQERERCRGSTNEPQMLLWTLLTAVLSGDEDAMREAAESGASVEHADPKYFTQFDRCLVGLLDGDDNAVRAAADELAASEDDAADRLDYYDGLGATCRAIAAEDTDALDRGLAAVLERHEELVPTFGATMDDGLVCIPATALLVLARRRGLAVEGLDALDSEYVPRELVE